jgi:pyridoxamine 5'-phosphate oxidase
MNPISKFNEWFAGAVQKCAASLPAACCFSTVGLDGFPNARFVSLKEVVENRFVVCGPLDSRKGEEIAENSRVALTFWWPEVEKQVRIQGKASLLDAGIADRYFAERNRESQLVSHLSRQGEPLANQEAWEKAIEAEILSNVAESISRPNRWGGWMIEPVRIEFLEFRASRLHRRELFTRVDAGWELTFLQP